MAERTTVRLPVDLIERAKKKAAAEGRSLTALIEDGLRLVVNDAPAEARKPRVLPPVSTAGGGLMPGIGLDDSAALQDIEDRNAAASRS